MSNSPETDFDLDLHFLPAWAQKSADPNRYAKYVGESAPDDRKERERGDRRPRLRQNRDRDKAAGFPPGRKPEGRRPSRYPEDGRRPEEKARREPVAPPPLP